MKKIEASVVLINALQTRESVTLEVLEKIRKRVLREFPLVHLGVTKEEVQEACRRYSEFMVEENGVIKRGERWLGVSSDDTATAFNRSIPDECRVRVLKIISGV